MGVIDKFMPLLLEREEEGRQSPALEHPEATFIYVRYSNLYCKSSTFFHIVCCGAIDKAFGVT